jgi:hypothetical protein
MEKTTKSSSQVMALCLWSFVALAVPEVGEAAPFAFPGLSTTPKKKDMKKPKKNADSEESFGPPDIPPIARGDADIGVGVHRDQEGVDHPYVNEIALSGLFNMMRRENSNSADRPTDDRSSQLGLEVSMFFRSVQVGAAVEYGYSSQTTAAPPAEGESQLPSKFRTETGRYSVGPVFKYNFKNIDRSLLVPFALLSFAYTEQLTTGTGISSSGRRGTVGRVGGGLNMFLASHVAFAPRLEYVSTQTTGRGNDSGTEKSSGLRFTLQLSIFI